MPVGGKAIRTHAFAKRDAAWDALLCLALWDHNWQRTQPALRTAQGQRSPAMASHLTDHLWTWEQFLTTPA